MRTCFGCGRLLGLRAEAGCPCWTSVNEKALIPDRLHDLTKQYRREREKKKR